jgi:hypothetical protein
MKRALVCAVMLLGCSSPDEDARISLPKEDLEAFRGVSAMLQPSCGTLDCHGRTTRNLRLHGYGGLRLSDLDRPDGRPTTDEELAISVRAIRALEPEKLNAPPNELTFFRKAMNLEHHKGGARLDANGEKCLRAWLTGGRDDAACSAAAQR